MSDPDEELAVNLLRAFHADVGHLSDEARARIRQRVLAGVEERRQRADAALGGARLDARLDARHLVPASAASAPVAPSPWRGGPILALAAAVTLVVGLAVVGPRVGGGGGDQVASDRTSAPVLAAADPDLQEVAARAARRPSMVFDAGDARYAHRVVVWGPPRSIAEGEAASTVRVETWVARDGTGRTLTTRGDGVDGTDRIASDVGTLRLGGLLPSAVADLPEDTGPLLDRMLELQALAGDPGGDLASSIIDLLAQAGVPASVRSTLLTALHDLDFRPVASEPSDLGTTYEGPGHEGATLRLVLDADTVPVLLEVVKADGSSAVASYAEIDLRPDLGS